MILFKQFLYRVVQGALDLEESTLSVFGKDGDRDCAFSHRYNPFIDGPADDLGDCLADPGQFFGEQFFDGIEILETDADLERIPGIHTGHIDDILDIPIADDLDVASGPFQFLISRLPMILMLPPVPSTLVVLTPISSTSPR